MSTFTALRPMDILINALDSNSINGPTRILDIELNSTESMIWLIDCERTQKLNTARRKAYVCNPYCLPLSEIEQEINTGKLLVVKNHTSGKLLIKDSDRLRLCKSDNQRKAIFRNLSHRDLHFETIKPLICLPESNIPQRVSKIMRDSETPSRIRDRAKETGHSYSTLRNWMNKYWSGGCQKNALLAGYEGRCGNPGKEKKQSKKLGRSPRLYRSGNWSTRGYPINEIDKQKLSHGFSLITKELPPKDAYLLTCAAYWAQHEITDAGDIRPVLYSKEMRPSFDQFMRWGARLHGKTVRQKILGDTKWQQERKTTGGSEQDSLVAVGQQGMFDGTSPDVYLVSSRNRLKKLPPFTRLVLKEGRTGIIYGIYCGWEPPSPKTALLAILHGALEDKREWANRFGVEIDEDSIPGLLPRQILADNGELKGHEPTEFENQFGIGISYTRANYGSDKGGIESDHHKIHSHLDHRLPGSTHGKPSSRGQPHAALNALWNYSEYMRELIKWIIWHNTVEEVPDLAPEEMLLLQADIRPTRINIYRWLSERGLNVCLNVNYEHLRAFTLQDVEAVITRNGIRLIGKIHGHKTKLFRLRYTSKHLSETGLLTQVKLTGKEIPTRVKLNPTDLSQAWLPTPNGMIQVLHSSRDQLINKNFVLNEWISYCEEQTLISDMAKKDVEQHRADFVLRNQAVTISAKAELNAEIASLKKKPSRASIIANLDAHRREEIELLRQQEQLFDKACDFNEPAELNPVHRTPTLADGAMLDFLRDL